MMEDKFGNPAPFCSLNEKIICPMTDHQEKPTRWDALKSILLSPDKRKAIGSAWSLYFYLIFRLDSDNQFVTNFAELAGDLSEKPETVKKWKEKLVRGGVISSRKVKHGVALSLFPPYDSPATALKDDIVELRLRSDVKTRNMLKMALGADYLVLLPILADLAQRIERLEKMKQPSH